MQSIPSKLTSIIPVRELQKVEDWWEKLSVENQIELETIYQEDTDNQEQFVAIHLCGEFVEQELPKQHDVFWVNHFYEYLINHDLFIDSRKPPVGRICSANKVAAQAIRTGVIGKDYLCPDTSVDACQMKQLLNLDPGKSLHLFVKFTLVGNATIKKSIKL